MAKEQALQFIARVNEDQILRTKLQAFEKDRIEGVVKIAKEAGFDVSAEDLQSAAADEAKSQAGEMSDEALESIAGGVNGDGVSAPPPSNSFLIGLLLPTVQSPEYFTKK